VLKRNETGFVLDYSEILPTVQNMSECAAVADIPNGVRPRNKSDALSAN